MSFKKDKPWFENKSNYLVGLGIGMSISALFFPPASGMSATRNLWWGIIGIAYMIIGGILGNIAKKKDK